MGGRSADPSTVEQTIGERLRARRVELGLTQEQLGSAVGLSYQQIQKYENGTNQISVCRLLILSERLGVPAACFLVGLPGAQADGSISPDGELAPLLGRVRNGSVRQAVAGLVRSVAERQA